METENLISSLDFRAWSVKLQSERHVDKFQELATKIVMMKLNGYFSNLHTGVQAASLDYLLSGTPVIIKVTSIFFPQMLSDCFQSVENFQVMSESTSELNLFKHVFLLLGVLKMNK